ncbi:MAG: fibronectin type III domain-containing protein [Patescibacteria group bacterium]|nr:fibronectin type III domain-containing protein [Patescibacteria group bacterium]
MIKKALFFVFAIAVIFSICLIENVANATTNTETNYAGQVVKMDGLSTLYYVASDGKRYVFPNKKTFDTWFPDFDDVVTLTAEELQAIPLGGNVRYRPGVVLVKITTDPKVYAVAKNGRLRWVKNEQIAKKLYGDSWNLLVDDIPDSFFTNYTIDEPIENESSYDADTEVTETETVEGNRGLALGHTHRARTVKCRAIPAQSNGPGNRATPAISARECKLQSGDGNNDSDNNNEEETDTIAPFISNIIKTITSTTANITWNTDENTTDTLYYSDATPVIASSSNSVAAENAATASHAVDLEELTASTTYYFIIQAIDESGNQTTSNEDTFATLAE